MNDPEQSPLQSCVAAAIARSGKARDHFDSILRKELGTSGKPLWDIERGKSRRPEPKTLRAIERALTLEAESLVDLIHPRVDRLSAAASDSAPEAGHRSDRPEQPLTRSVDAGETVGIVQLDLSVAMGSGTIIDDFTESEVVSFDAASLRRITRTPSTQLRFVTGIGSSHEPKFQNGDQFLIDINDRQLTRLDGYYWITFDGAHALKRLRPLGNGMIQIISENPDYGPMELERSAVRIEGRAIWFARGL